MRAEPRGVKEIHDFILQFQSELVGIGGERDFGAH